MTKKALQLIKASEKVKIENNISDDFVITSF